MLGDHAAVHLPRLPLLTVAPGMTANGELIAFCCISKTQQHQVEHHLNGVHCAFCCIIKTQRHQGEHHLSWRVPQPISQRHSLTARVISRQLTDDDVQCCSLLSSMQPDATCIVHYLQPFVDMITTNIVRVHCGNASDAGHCNEMYSGSHDARNSGCMSYFGVDIMRIAWYATSAQHHARSVQCLVIDVKRLEQRNKDAA